MTEMSLCSKCKAEPKLKGYWLCRVCHNKYQLEWTKKNRDKVNRYNLSWRERNRDITREAKKRFYRNHNIESKEYQKNARALCKVDVFNHYSGGNICCACCGETAIQFLSIDHINGDGAKHRRENSAEGSSLYSWLKRRGYPEGYQILCFNCNRGKGTGAHCPHKEIGYDTNKNQISKEKIKREIKNLPTIGISPAPNNMAFDWVKRTDLTKSLGLGD